MRGDHARTPRPKVESFSYGGQGQKTLTAVEIKRLFTQLNANPTLAVRLANALGLKDLPGHPGFAVMDKVIVQADMFQAGFANYERVNGKKAEFIVTHEVANFATFDGIFAAPAKSGIATIGLNIFGEPIYLNADKDLRVSNAWVRVNSQTPNPNTDTDPLSLHCSFLLDGNVAWESIQNNLVSSAADGSFMFQTADSNWDGIVPAGSVFSFHYFVYNGATGAVAAADDSNLNVTCGLLGLAVPMGAQIPR